MNNNTIHISILTLILSLICLFGTSSTAFGQKSRASIRTFPASCEDVCNGSAEFMNYHVKPERYYLWKSADEQLYHPLNDAYLGNLCPGKYRMREINVLFEEARLHNLSGDSIPGFEGINMLRFNSLGKREVSVYIELDIEVNYLNYYMSATYSLDGGSTWKASSQFHQKVIEEYGGGQKVCYLMNLPKSASYLDEILVKIYRRKADAEHEPPMMAVLNANIESKRVTESVFEVRTQEAIHILSTVSNEIEGGDGYISLELSGGTKPYMIFWNDQENGVVRDSLTQGLYKVEVVDHRKCRQNAEFVVLPPEGVSKNGHFRLERITSQGLYRLRVNGLYRQPLDLIISSELSKEVKKYKINPLYEDLKMDIDLSYLPKGAYTVTLSTTGYSKNSEIFID